MSFARKTKRILTIFLLTVFLGTFLNTASLTANADFLDDLGDLFTTGEQGITFTEYEGTLAELDKGGYAAELVETGDLREFIVKVVNFALGFLGLIAVIVVIYGGVLYVTAAGEEEKTQKGKKSIGYAAIGLLIVMGSYAFVNTIIKGAGGGAEVGTRYVVGANTGASFNASAIQVRTMAAEIYEGFINLAESTEELRNIRNDANTLSYKNTIVTKNEILSFQFSTKQKLLNMRTKVLKFSSTYIKINDLIRKLDTDTADINGYRNNARVTIDGEGNLKVCRQTYKNDADSEDYVLRPLPAGRPPKDAAKEFADEVEVVDSTELNANTILKFIEVGKEVSFWKQLCSDSDYAPYSLELFQKWNNIRTNITGLNPSDDPLDDPLSEIMRTIKDDYKKALVEKLFEIKEIRDALVGIDAVETGSVGKLYDEMMDDDGHYGFDTDGYKGGSSDPNKYEQDKVYKLGFTGSIESWSIKVGIEVDVEESGGILFKSLEKHLDFADALAELQIVEAHLRANVVTGNAPLLVTFDVLDTIDPAGGSIIDDNVVWENITGTKTFEGKDVKIALGAVEAVNCTQQLTEIKDEEDKEFFGPAYRQCKFNYPGTYIATVTVKSNDPSKYVAGMSSLIIKVNPPTSRIEMELKLEPGPTSVPIIAYDPNEILTLDENYIRVTIDEAKEGITFDATETKNVTNFKWDFGNGETKDVDLVGEQTMEYRDPAKYMVILEVTNQIGELNRKIFTLDVTNVAPRIQIVPGENVFIKNPVNIDGTQSSVSTGKIRSHEWKIEKIVSLGQPGQDIPLGNNANKASFTHEFEEPGTYKITLTINSDISEPATETRTLAVESKLPVPIISHEIPEANQPGTVQFNAERSYDPDGPTDNIEYAWSIEPVSDGENWEWIGGNADAEFIDLKNPKIKFKEKGDYEVTLKVTDSTTVGAGLIEESDEIKKTVTIDNILDIEWGEQEITTLLNDEGEATMNFAIESDNAIAYEIDFGDGEEEESGDITVSATIPHTYRQAGKYTVKVTAYDEEDSDITIQRRVFIGDGSELIAKAGLMLGDVEIQDLSQPIKVSKKDILTFDAGKSKNIDGTGRDLKYSWDFGDTGKSSKKQAIHSYKELSPKDPGYFTVRLRIIDKDDATLTGEDEIQINVVNVAPVFSSVQGIPQSTRADLITPVVVNMRVFGAEDPDGEITKYKWWYFDVDDPDEPLGIQITQQAFAQLTIGTKGKEGKDATYGFGLEVTDSDNLTFSNEEEIEEEKFSEITVVNGPNEPPTAKFNVNATSVFAGDKVTFTSASSDKDGSIVQYIWDMEGDGFYNNEPTNESTLEHIYTAKNLDGYDTRLKVIDNKGGETVSDSILIYVDSLAEPPAAAFKHEVMEGSEGMKIKFINNSKADAKAGAKILSSSWDFDTDSSLVTADSDGDGVKNNDVDSQAENPERLYTAQGTYNVKLIVIDDQGNVDEVINRITIPLANPPAAAFTYEIIDKKVVFKNNSTADVKNDAEIEEYIWDFDTASALITADSDGDGQKDNDADSELKEPIHQYPDPGIYTVKLTVKDNQGNTDDVTNSVNFTISAPTPTGPIPEGEVPTVEILTSTLIPDPAPAADGIVYIDGESGTVRFDFSKSIGPIAYYIIDKNIYFDTNGNSIKNDDEDFKTSFPGTWRTNFRKEWGKTVVKLTVMDIYGNENSTTLEIKFK